MLQMPKNSMRVMPEYQPLMRRAGLDVETVFTHPDVVSWRKLPDRENCTLDVEREDGTRARFHIKRYHPARGVTTPADDEVKGHELLEFDKIPTATLVGFGNLADRRSFVIFADLEGYTPADKLIEGGMPFERLREPTADLTAHLHRAGRIIATCISVISWPKWRASESTCGSSTPPACAGSAGFSRGAAGSSKTWPSSGTARGGCR